MCEFSVVDDLVAKVRQTGVENRGEGGRRREKFEGFRLLYFLANCHVIPVAERLVNIQI